ncbi:MAG: nitroreductase family protein [Asgard group archaeon]|nr:nitroreductase family protein [Asgard group archaeon]
MEAIKTRRSIRKFIDKLVSKEDIEDLIRAAMQAPSAGNKQPWQFVVITDRKKLDKIPDFHPYSIMLKESPLAILICAKVETSEYCDYWVQDCSAATQNLLLAAHAKGLGAVWLGIYPIAERIDGIKQLLNLPPDIVPLSLNAIGYPAEKKDPINRFDKARIHYEEW